MKINAILVSTLFASSAFFAACGGSDHSKQDKADTVVAALESYVPSYTVTTVKLDSVRGNWVVISATNGGPVSYLAINLDLITAGMDPSTVISTLTSAGSAGVESVNPTGSYGNFYVAASGNVYEETEISSKDLNKMAAVVDAVKLQDISKQLVERYGLSEERGFKVAKLTTQWSRLSKSRSMTDSDAENLSKQLLGINISDAEDAYAKLQNGDASQYNELMIKAAAVNGVSAEKMRAIIADVVSQ